MTIAHHCLITATILYIKVIVHVFLLPILTVELRLSKLTHLQGLTLKLTCLTLSFMLILLFLLSHTVLIKMISCLSLNFKLFKFL